MMGYRIKKFLLYPIIFVLSIIIPGLLITFQVLEIGTKGPLVRVHDGEILILKYIHSMYGVSVQEKIMIEKDRLKVFYVSTSEAALEYFGIERKGEGNVDRAVKGFIIPKESTGHHILVFRNRELKINECGDIDGSIHVRIRKIPLLVYVVYSFWRSI